MSAWQLAGKPRRLSRLATPVATRACACRETNGKDTPLRLMLEGPSDERVVRSADPATPRTCRTRAWRSGPAPYRWLSQEFEPDGMRTRRVAENRSRRIWREPTCLIEAFPSFPHRPPTSCPGVMSHRCRPRFPVRKARRTMMGMVKASLVLMTIPVFSEGLSSSTLSRLSSVSVTFK